MVDILGAKYQRGYLLVEFAKAAIAGLLAPGYSETEALDRGPRQAWAIAEEMVAEAERRYGPASTTSLPSGGPTGP